jgi:phosphoribosylformylglycinamidine synthase
VRLLFSENPALVIQVAADGKVSELLKSRGVAFTTLGRYQQGAEMKIVHGTRNWNFQVAELRNTWFTTSYLLEKNQTVPELAESRFANYARQPLHFKFPGSHTGKLSQFGLELRRRAPSGIKAAIIREKGVNGDREMAFMMYLAGLDVKDVHMTDLISGRETLDDVNLIVFVGGFSNSDVLGSAKGWAGAFLYNPAAQNTLQRFYSRKDTLSLGVCNGCQLMAELGLITPAHEEKPVMLHNASGKFESAFLGVDIPENRSVMLGSLAGSTLGIWVAHGEGRFRFPYTEDKYHVAMKYSYADYPGNPNGSDYGIAGICSDDGRHLAIMPHLERAIFSWNWAHYPAERKSDEVSPWITAFVNAREWIHSFPKGQA